MDTRNTHTIIKKRDWRWWEEDPLKLVKLETAFAYDANDEEACAYAEISLDQLYYYAREINPDFQVRKAWLKKHPILKARETVVKSLKDNPELAFKYLERKAPSEFGLPKDDKSTVTNNILVMGDDRLAEYVTGLLKGPSVSEDIKTNTEGSVIGETGAIAENSQ